MRLTNKDGTYTHHLVEYHKGQKCEGNITHNNPATKKLGQIEDFEDELGIDLVILLKALKNGVYCKYPSDLMCAVELCFNNGMYGYNQGQFYFCDYKDNEYWLKDYGKTWALTKEELE